MRTSFTPRPHFHTSHSLSLSTSMGWSHPDISLDDLMRHIKGFVDILILASGYQSSGLPATWDAENIKKSLKWGLFFEDVFQCLHDSANYDSSVKELDAALHGLTSDPLFPQGLSNMSSASLARARHMILCYLLHTHPLKDEHLTALLVGVIEMDIEDLMRTDNGSTDMCIDKLMLQVESLSLVPVGRSFMINSSTSSMEIGSKDPLGSKCLLCDPKSTNKSFMEPKACSSVGHSCFVIQELLKRHDIMLSISTIESGLGTVSKVFTRNHMVGSADSPSKGQPSSGSSLRDGEKLAELVLWNQWKSNCLLYLLNKRTIRLLSGANLIFGSPKVQWIHVFESLKVSMAAQDTNLLEIVEISLLGFISSRWKLLIEYIVSHSFGFLPVLKQYSSLQNLLQGNPQSFDSRNEDMTSKEKDIVEYLAQSLVTRPCVLWQLPPVLAATIPSWSLLFKMYLSEIERHFNGSSSSVSTDAVVAIRREMSTETVKLLKGFGVLTCSTT